MNPSSDDFDVVLHAQILVDDYYIASGTDIDRLRREMEFDVKRRLRREIERKLPEGYTLDDCVYSEYVTFRDERNFRCTTYQLRVYL